MQMFIHIELISVSIRWNLFYIFVNTEYLACIWFHNAVKYCYDDDILTFEVGPQYSV